MKKIIRLLAVSAGLATSTYAAPFLAIDDNAEVFITGTVGIRVDSNIFLTPNRQSDTIFDVNPGLQLVFGKASAVQGALTLTESFATYTDHAELNDNLSSVDFVTNYDDGKSKLTVNASYNELNQNTVDTLPGTVVDGLIRRDVIALGGVGEVSVTEKSSIAGGIQYNNSEFERANFSDSEMISLPVNYYYEITPKVDMSFGYRFRKRWESIGFDTKDHFLSVGARGEFTPKLSGHFAVGVTKREFSHKVMNLSDESLLGVDSSLVYAASEKTTIQLGVSNDFDTNSQGDQQKNFVVRVAATSAISSQFSVTVGASFRKIDYYTRIDDYFEGRIAATYTVSNNMNITGAIALRSNDSDLPTSNFDGNVVSLAANFRF